MTELEKEINNLRSGLKSVESVSAALILIVHKLKSKSSTQAFSHAGVRIPEEESSAVWG